MIKGIGKNYTVKQDGTGKITIEKKPWRNLDASAQIRMRKSKRIKVVSHPQIDFKRK